MVQPVQNAGQAATKYTPMMFTSPGQKPIVISFVKGTDIAVDEKTYSTKKPGAVELDAKHYAALLKADANGDKKIDAEDAKVFNKKHTPGVTATNLGVNVDMKNNKRVGFFFPGYIQYNQTHAVD